MQRVSSIYISTKTQSISNGLIMMRFFKAAPGISFIAFIWGQWTKKIQVRFRIGTSFWKIFNQNFDEPDYNFEWTQAVNSWFSRKRLF